VHTDLCFTLCIYYYMKLPIQYYEARSLNEQRAAVGLSRQIFHSRKLEPQFYDAQLLCGVPTFCSRTIAPHRHVPHGHVTLLNYIFHASAHPVHGVGVRLCFRVIRPCVRAWAYVRTCAPIDGGMPDLLAIDFYFPVIVCFFLIHSLRSILFWSVLFCSIHRVQ